MNKKSALFLVIILVTGMAVSHAGKSKNSTAPEASQAAEGKRAEIAKARAENIQPVPEIKADYVFPASQIKPGWQDMAGIKMLKDYFGNGFDAAEYKPKGSPLFRVGSMVYWKLEGIKPGTYYPCLWLETGRERDKRFGPYTYESEYDPTTLLTTIYHNGWPVRFSTTSDPVQVKSGRWLAELQAAKPVKLENGDEIAVAIPVNVMGNYPSKMLRLALYREEPLRGHGVTGQTFSVLPGTAQRIRLVLHPEILGKGLDGGEHKVRIFMANPLPYAIDAVLDWKLADYFGAPIVEKSELIHLEPHKTKTISYPFKAKGDECAYQLSVRTRPAEGFSFPIPRPVEMMELSDYSRLEFLPNQPDPLTVRGHARIDLKNDKNGERKFLSLGGKGWESAWLKGRKVPEKVPEDLVFTPGLRPRKPKDGKPRFGKWLRKKFKTPAWLRGEKYLIEITEFSSEATLFLNGKLIASQKGQRLPLVTDVSSALRLDAENELVVCLRGMIALLTPDYAQKYDASSHWAAKNHMNHGGSFFNGYSSAWLRDVLLQAVPGVRVAQTLIIPEVDKKALKIMTRVENLDEREREVEIEFEIYQKGKKIPLDIPKIKTILKAGEKKELVLNATVDGEGKDVLVPYTHKNPVLAKLVTKIVEKDKTVDISELRFGYRTVKVKGADLTLNGKKVKWIGGSFNPLSTVFEDEDGISIRRKWKNRRGGMELDLFDEIGLFTYPENGIHGEHEWELLNNKRFWDTMRDFQVELVWRYGSHPATAAWSLSNESHYGVWRLLGRDAALKAVEHLASCAEAVKKKIWPDFWFIADGDEDLEGNINFFSFHYLNQYGGKFKSLPEGEKKTVAFYPPDSFHFNNKSSKVPRKGEKSYKPYVTGNHWIYGEKAIGDTENLWFHDKENGPSAARQVGDRATVSTAWQYQTARGMSHTKMTIDACRDMEMPFIAFGDMDFYTVSTQNVTFAMPEQQIRYYSGSKFDRRVNIHDDEFIPGNLDFRWRLLDPAGKPVRDGQIKLKSDTSTLKRDRIAFDVPKVNKRTKFTLTMELWKDGKKRAFEERVVDVWPKLKKTPVELKNIIVYDPKNSLSPVLKQMGYTFKTVAKLDGAALKGMQGVLIGPDAVDDAIFAPGRPVQQFLKTGGRILLLRQKEGALAKLGVAFEPRAWFSVGFVRTPEHPIMRGLKDMDFQMWNPDHLITKGAYRKPLGGSFLPLVDCCLETSMEWSPLLELYVGKGAVIASQLALVKDFKQEPICAEILKRALSYLEQPAFRSPDQSLAVLQGASSQVIRRLNEVRAGFKVEKNLNPKKTVTLLDLTGTGPIPEASKVKAYLEQGGTLIAHRASPKNQAWINSVIGKPVAIKVQPYKCWADRLMLDRRDGLATGVNNLDLYWRPLVRGCHIPSYKQISSAPSKEIGQVDYLVEVDGIEDYFFPGGLLEIPVGKGKLLVDQLNWETQVKNFVSGNPRRFLAMMLSNLGVKCKVPSPKPRLSKEVTFEPIDTSSVANLGLKDEKAGDGHGWCDWGPKKTLKAFPTGETKLGGTPYIVPKGDKNFVALRVNPKWLPHLAEYPDSVPIPINKKRVAGLLFLHGGGWINGNDVFGERQVIYTDGTVEIIPMNSSNMADWNYGRDSFPEELDTRTLTVWKRKAEGSYQPRVYQTLWLNPHPEKTIKEMVISNRGVPLERCRFTPHLALTAAILPPLNKHTDVPRDIEKSQALCKVARELEKAGKQQAAVAKLEEALKADPKNVDAWASLAAIRSKTYDLPKFEELHRRWLASMPDSTMAWNTLADFYEKKGEKGKALKAYKKSLAIFFNQLPIREKVETLENDLNQSK